MEICVCGWYYYEDLMLLLDVVHEKHPVFVVAHRYDKILLDRKYNHCLKENIGVEYGAYDWFIKNQWNGKSKVLFMHDDVKILPIARDYETLDPILFFNAIANQTPDLAYIFKNGYDERVNYGVHGRGILMSAKFINYLLEEHDGIWWDKGNDGHIIGPTPDHCYHFNEADYRLREIWRNLQKNGNTMDVGSPIYAAAFDAAYRGDRNEVRPPINNVGNGPG